MDFGAYGRLLQDPRIRHLLAVGFIARFPHTAAGVILTLHVALTLGLGYGQAGLAGAAMTLGIAVGSPWRGRVVDAKGLRRALLPSVIAEAVIWPIVPWLPFWPMLLAVFLGGVFSLPIFSVVRQGLGVLTHGKDRQTAFALDSIVTETIFMMGPALGAVVAATWSSALGLTIVGLSSALGGILLMWFNPPTRSSQLAVVGPVTEDPYTEEQDRQEAIAQAVTAAPMHVEMAAPSLATGALPAITEAIPIVTGALPVIAADGSGPTTAPRRARAERLRQWRRSHFSWVGSEVLGVLVVSMAAGIVMVGTEVSMVAELESQGAAASVGLVYAFWCGASAVGGLFYGAWGRQVHPYLLMALFAVATVPLALVDGVWALALASIPSGLLTAPTLASASSRLSQLVVEERRGEAMGFYGSAMTAGAAMGAPLAGVFIDGVAPSAGYVFAAAAGFVLVLLAALATVARGRRSA